MGAATVKRWLPPIRPSSSSSHSSSWYPDNFVVDPDVVDDHIAGTDVGPLVKNDADRCNIPVDAALAAREGIKRRIEPDLPPTRLRVLGLRPVHAAEEASPGPGYHVKTGRPCATVAVRPPRSRRRENRRCRTPGCSEMLRVWVESACSARPPPQSLRSQCASGDRVQTASCRPSSRALQRPAPTSRGIRARNEKGPPRKRPQSQPTAKSQ